MSTAPAWVLATRNAGKVIELRAFFSALGIHVIDLREAGVEEDADAEAVIESFDTFEENALAKARYFAKCLPGRIILADDSGLAVDALGGAPGVRSKRWSGRADLGGQALDAQNNVRLLDAVRDMPDRTARFVCAAAFSDGHTDVVTSGEIVGRIVDQSSGSHGFGYDPHFHVDELDMTLAAATVQQKEQISHRGRAFRALLVQLRSRGIFDFRD